LVRIGSANLNNRSLGLDTECDVALEATDEPHFEQTRLAIQEFLDHLIGHYIDRSAGDVRAAIREHGGLAAAIEALDNPEHRRLAPVELRQPSLFQKVVLHYALGDPTSPSDAWRPWRRRKRIKAQVAALLPPIDPVPPLAEDGPTPRAPRRRKASRPS
jgi:phosphatidylserine/phosphatidylglycerophosphate/cardiolipin synthase-like enzyme